MSNNKTVQMSVTFRKIRNGKNGNDGNGISSSNVWYALTNSGTTIPADTEFIYDNFSEIRMASSKYLWSATKVSYTNATSYLIGKACLGSCDDFAAVEELYGLSDQPTSAPRPNKMYSAANFATQYPTKASRAGKWLWTCSRVEYNNNTTISYKNFHCVGYMGEDGGNGKNVIVADTYSRDFTTTQWGIYSEKGHSETWLKIKNYAEFSVGDTMVILGTDMTKNVGVQLYTKVTAIGTPTEVEGEMSAAITATTLSFLEGGKDGDSAKYVIVTGEQVFAYSNDFTGNPAVTSISLKAELYGGLTGYQWSYKKAGDNSFTNMANASVSEVIISHNDSNFWGTGNAIKSCTFRCTSGDYYDEITIVKVSSGKNGNDAYTVILSNECHTFTGEDGHALADSTECVVTVYKGAGKINASIGNLTDGKGNTISPTLGDIRATKSNNTGSSDNPTLTISVLASLTTTSGIINVPIIADGKTICTKQFSWSLSMKGNTGISGYNTATVFLFKRSETRPFTAPNSGFGQLTYNFASKALTSVPTGWSLTPPTTGTGRVWVTAATASSREDTDKIESNEWATPIEFNGKDATELVAVPVMLFRRSSSNLTRSHLPTDTIGYYVQKNVVSGLVDGHLLETTSGCLNGWSLNIPTGSTQCWVIQATFLCSRDSEGHLYDDIIQEEWSTPAKYVVDGQNGYNTATVHLYKRAATRPFTAPNSGFGQLTYNFASKALTSVPTGWSLVPPASNEDVQCWVTAATASGKGDTDTIDGNEWATPVRFDGMNGESYVSAPVHLFRRLSSTPAKPTAAIDYYFQPDNSKIDKHIEESASGCLNGWSLNIPSGSAQCWIIQATALGEPNDCDTIDNSEWSEPAKYIKDGTSITGDEGKSAFDITVTPLTFETSNDSAVGIGKVILTNNNVATISAKYKGYAATVAVNSIKSTNNCTANKSGATVIIQSVTTKHYKDDGTEDASGTAYHIPATSGFAVASVTFTYGSYSETLDVTVEWSVNLNSHFGKFHHDMKSFESTLRTLGSEVEGYEQEISDIRQTANSISAKVGLIEKAAVNLIPNSKIELPVKSAILPRLYGISLTKGRKYTLAAKGYITSALYNAGYRLSIYVVKGEWNWSTRVMFDNTSTDIKRNVFTYNPPATADGDIWWYATITNTNGNGQNQSVSYGFLDWAVILDGEVDVSDISYSRCATEPIVYGNLLWGSRSFKCNLVRKVWVRWKNASGNLLTTAAGATHIGYALTGFGESAPTGVGSYKWYSGNSYASIPERASLVENCLWGLDSVWTGGAVNMGSDGVMGLPFCVNTNSESMGLSSGYWSKVCALPFTAYDPGIYTVSFYAKSSTGSTLKVRLDGAVLTASCASNGAMNVIMGANTDGETDFALTSDFARYSITMQVNSTTAERELQFLMQRGGSQNLNILCAKIEKCGRATLWCEGSGDQDKILDTGIDIFRRRIKITADNVEFQDNQGDFAAMVSGEGITAHSFVAFRPDGTAAISLNYSPDGNFGLEKLVQWWSDGVTPRMSFGDGFITYFDSNGNQLWALGSDGVVSKNSTGTNYVEDTYERYDFYTVNADGSISSYKSLIVYKFVAGVLTTANSTFNGKYFTSNSGTPTSAKYVNGVYGASNNVMNTTPQTATTVGEGGYPTYNGTECRYHRQCVKFVNGVKSNCYAYYDINKNFLGFGKSSFKGSMIEPEVIPLS